jgi:hypothetical protein
MDLINESEELRYSARRYTHLLSNDLLYAVFPSRKVCASVNSQFISSLHLSNHRYRLGCDLYGMGLSVPVAILHVKMVIIPILRLDHTDSRMNIALDHLARANGVPSA